MYRTPAPEDQAKNRKSGRNVWLLAALSLRTVRYSLNFVLSEGHFDSLYL